jgi:ribosome maturation factor RimP
MSIAHVKLPGLDEARIVALVEPVLSAHGVDGVELLWKTDSTGWVLTVNIEKPGTKMPGEGITVDLCSNISRDISAAMDVDEVVIPHAYRLEVGSPGIERHLYLLEDYRRFAGRTVKARLRKPVGELRAFRGKLSGVNEESRVVFVIDDTTISSPLEDIMTCRLVFEWDTPNLSDGAKAKSPKPRSSDRARSNRSSKRNR